MYSLCCSVWYFLFHCIIFFAWLLFNTNSAMFQWREQANFQWDDDEVHFVLNKNTELDFYSASSLKQMSVDRQVAPLWLIMLILSQPVFGISPYCYVLWVEATNIDTNFIVFSLIRVGLEPMIYHTGGVHTNHYTIEMVLHKKISQTCVKRSPLEQRKSGPIRQVTS